MSTTTTAASSRTTIVIDPITRIEGHLKIEAIVEGGVVKEARSSGTLYRGFEGILRGRDPRDAQQITQRICGVCPQAHGTAAALCLDSAFGLAGAIPDNGRIVRNLLLGANYIQSHVLHFYHLAALDYVDVAAAAGYEGTDPDLASVADFVRRGELAPFVPRYEGDYRLPAELNRAATAHYVQALTMRRKAHEMLAIFGGKMPHSVGVVPGGATVEPTVDRIAAFLWRLNELRHFIDNVYVPDVLAVAGAYPDYFGIGRGCGRYLSYGVFDLDGAEPSYVDRRRFLPAGTTDAGLDVSPVRAERITEHVRHSWYADAATGLNPAMGRTEPDRDKPGAYSWLKAPRYDGRAHEVGPLARVLVAYAAGDPAVRKTVDGVLAHSGAGPDALFSVLGRHAARALECKLTADAMAEWVLGLKPGQPTYVEHALPESASGVGLVDAARGALGHWIDVREGRIANYQCVVPTTWNASPRGDDGEPGPIEQAIEGTRIRDQGNPFEIVRIVRSFDPCTACAVHLVTPRGRSLGAFHV